MSVLRDGVGRIRNARAAKQPPLLSVVVPVYKVEDYLPTTLRSEAKDRSLRAPVAGFSSGTRGAGR